MSNNLVVARLRSSPPDPPHAAPDRGGVLMAGKPDSRQFDQFHASVLGATVLAAIVGNRAVLAITF